MTYTPSLKPNTRIDVADVLRGIAIGGIIHLELLKISKLRYPCNE